MPLAAIVAHWMSGVWPEGGIPVVTPVYGTACAIVFPSGAIGEVLVPGITSRALKSGAKSSAKFPDDC